MGVSDSSPVCLSDHHHEKDTQFAMEMERDKCNIISFRRRRRPSLEFFHQDACSQTAPVSSEDQQEDDGVSDSCTSSPLKVMKLPPPVITREGKKVVLDDEEVNGGGCKTPTSVDKKIPNRLLCPPPPPRKPKTLPSTNKKGHSRRRVLLDLSDEIESLFPPALLADFGNKIKKVRKETFII